MEADLSSQGVTKPNPSSDMWVTRKIPPTILLNHIPFPSACGITTKPVLNILLCCVLAFRQTRKDYITAKYTEKRFAHKRHVDLRVLYEAVRTRDIMSLLQVYAEGVDLMDTIPMANEHVRYTSDLCYQPTTFLFF